MTKHWFQKIVHAESSGREFPKSFPSTVKHVYRQLLRVFAHIYHSHFQQILHLRSEPHFNSLFAHFLSFGREYELLELKDVSGASSAPVGIGQLWEKWREMGILEGWEPFTHVSTIQVFWWISVRKNSKIKGSSNRYIYKIRERERGGDISIIEFLTL